MDRRTARSARALVTQERSVAARTSTAIARGVGVLLLIVVVALVVVIATGRA